MTNEEFNRALIKRALKEKILTPAQVTYATAVPGTYIGADGRMFRKCKYCCGVGKLHSILPLHAMYSIDTCKACYELITVWAIE